MLPRVKRSEIKAKCIYLHTSIRNNKVRLNVFLVLGNSHDFDNRRILMDMTSREETEKDNTKGAHVLLSGRTLASAPPINQKWCLDKEGDQWPRTAAWLSS